MHPDRGDMQAREIQAGGELAGTALGGIAELARGVHLAIADRAFGASGGAAIPARELHDRVAGLAYAAAQGALRTLPRGGAAVLALRAQPDAPALGETAAGAVALGALNGAVGDRLAAERSPLAIELCLRRGPQTPTRRIAVFVHGLGETEYVWRAVFGNRLHDELGYTPVYARYNTGRHISDNGEDLSARLEELVANWPEPVEEVVLVGHSMGGLVVRSACHLGNAAGAAWAAVARHVFCLGSPHLGAPLEKGANVLGWALGRMPETRPFAAAVNARSSGIKDLRYGALTEGEWAGHDPDEFLKDRCGEVPFLDTATYYFIGASVTSGPVGCVLGDLIVRYSSASGAGRTRQVGFAAEHGAHLRGLNHFDLLDHPVVYERIRAWLDAPPAPA